MGTLQTQFAETNKENKKLIMAYRTKKSWSDADNSLNQTGSLVQTDINQSKSSSAGNLRLRSSDRNDRVQKTSIDSAVYKQKGLYKEPSQGVAHYHKMNCGDGSSMNNHHDDDMRNLEQLFLNLNPMAQDFVPPIVADDVRPVLQNSAPHFAIGNTLVPANSHVAAVGNSVMQMKIGSSHRKVRDKRRTSMAQRKDVTRRTIFVPDMDNQVTEEQLAALFTSCGQIVEIRICGDPNTIFRFAFVEFTNEEGARNALSLAGTMLHCRPVKVLPSKTAIEPVNPRLLPTSKYERERCTRTIYCTNIDKKVTEKDVKDFFESFCGEVICMRLLGSWQYSTRIAFMEFVTAESAVAALNCSGVVMGSLPIRISPSKTPIRLIEANTM